MVTDGTPPKSGFNMTRDESLQADTGEVFTVSASDWYFYPFFGIGAD